MTRSDMKRFATKVKAMPSGCWEWQGSIARGHGKFFLGGKHVRAHRFSYQACTGIPLGELDCHHLCENKRCVNPSHLHATDRRNHLANLTPTNPAFIRSRATHCTNGHLFDERNTAIEEGCRRCRKCRADRNKKVRASTERKTSNHLGVTWDRLNRRWKVEMRCCGTSVYFGTYRDEAETVHVAEQVSPQLLEVRQTLKNLP